MATIAPSLIDGGLRLSAPGHDSIEVARPLENDRVVRALLGDDVAVGDAGDPAASWLGGVLGVACRLVAMSTPDGRRIPLVKTQPVTFVDAAPVLVVNEASRLDLVARASEPFGMERFRPNLIVRAGSPWVEDTWRSITVGAARLEALLPWPRCPIPQIDQDNAERHQEPALVLRAHRWCLSAPALPPGLRAAVEGNALFGVGFTIAPEAAVLHVNDTVTVRHTAEPLLAPPR